MQQEICSSLHMLQTVSALCITPPSPYIINSRMQSKQWSLRGDILKAKWHTATQSLNWMNRITVSATWKVVTQSDTWPSAHWTVHACNIIAPPIVGKKRAGMKAAIAWILNSRKILVSGSVVCNTSGVTSENEKKIIINNNEKKSKYISIFFPLSWGILHYIWWIVRNENQDDFPDYTPQKEMLL